MFKKTGPGVLVVAAFIGPGTVTTCTLAGVAFGYALLWAMPLSIIATIILQEMAARLGIITQNGLVDAIKGELKTPWVRNCIIGVVLAAIVTGNAAYEAGNIGGATLGMEALFGASSAMCYPLIVGAITFIFLYYGNYRLLEKILVSLVIVMSLSFVATAFMVKPDAMQILEGLFVPIIPKEGILTVIALVGTTVVPYNLFLHASLVSEKWKSKADLPTARWDTIISIAFGGLVSMAIILSAAAIPGNEVSTVMDLAKGLEPLYGDKATYFMGIGLFAAGTTSAITAPLAAAYVANNCFGWKAGMKGNKFKTVWMLILMLGVFFLSFDIKPMQIIKFAQVANGMLLPVIAAFLLWVMNRAVLMGAYRNTPLQNVLGTVIVALAFILGVKSILTVFGFL